MLVEIVFLIGEGEHAEKKAPQEIEFHFCLIAAGCNFNQRLGRKLILEASSRKERSIELESNKTNQCISGCQSEQEQKTQGKEHMIPTYTLQIDIPFDCTKATNQ